MPYGTIDLSVPPETGMPAGPSGYETSIGHIGRNATIDQWDRRVSTRDLSPSRRVTLGQVEAPARTHANAPMAPRVEDCVRTYRRASPSRNAASQRFSARRLWGEGPRACAGRTHSGGYFEECVNFWH